MDFDKISSYALDGLSDVWDSSDSDEKEPKLTKNYDLSNFSAIKCDGIAEIIFTQANNYQVKAIGGKSIMDNLIVKVEGNALVIDMKKISNIKVHRKTIVGLTVYVSAPKLNSLSLGGVAKFSAKALKGDSFTVSTSGVGKFSCPSLKCTKFTSKVSGASSINVNFQGDKADIENSGVSKYMMNVDCQELIVHNSGAGTMKISGTADKTDIHSSGVSKVDISNLNRY